MKKILIIVAALVVFGVAQTAHAETTAYLIKDDSNTVYQFNAKELETSYINNRFGHGDDSLYQSFKEKLSANGFYALLTDNNKYVDYKDLESTYLLNTSNFNLNEFLASDQSVEVEVLPSDITLVSNIDDSIAEPKESEEVMSDEEKSIHDYSKEGMRVWIDKESELERLRTYPIMNDQYYDDIATANENLIQSKLEAEIKNEFYFQPALGYMDVYYNRDYKTIGDEWIKEVRYYYAATFEYKGEEYLHYDNLADLFDVFVKETKQEKRISESIFVSDLSMLHQISSYTREGMKELKAQGLSGLEAITHSSWGTIELGDRVRGTQYIRYTSGTNLPEGVELNKWYKRDLDVQIGSFASNASWEKAPTTFDEIFPISSYEEVKK